MTNAPSPRIALILVAGVIAIVLAGLVLTRLATPPSPEPRSVVSLEEAVAVGILDQAIVDELRATGASVGFVSIDLPQLIARLERDAPELAAQLLQPERIEAIDRALAEAKAELTIELGAGASVVTDFENLSVIAIRFESEALLLAALRLPVVSTIRANRLGEADATESTAIVRAGEVHRAGFQGQGAYVAVLDTGVDATGYEQYFPTGSLAGAYRAEDAQAGDADGSATPFGHGTHVASTVLAMAPQARILSIEVFRMVEVDGEPKPQWSTGRLIDGIEYVVGLKQRYLADSSQCCNVVAMNLSLGFRGVRKLASCGDDYSFRKAWEVGIIPVTSAGNGALDDDGAFHEGVGEPACNTYALNVGATTDGAFPEHRLVRGGATVEYCEASAARDRPTTFSQSGRLLQMLAPGNCIVAAKGAKQGTSMAAPHVAGAVAALYSARPTAGPTAIWEALTQNGEPIVDPRPSPAVTRNRLDIALALEALTGAALPVPTPGAPVIGLRAVALGPATVAPDAPVAAGSRQGLDRLGIRNVGTTTGSYQLAVEPSGLALGSGAPASWFAFRPQTVTLLPGELGFVEVDLAVPAGAAPGAYAASIRARDVLAADGGIGNAVSVTFEVQGEDDADAGGSGLIVLLVLGVLAGIVIYAVASRARRTT